MPQQEYIKYLYEKEDCSIAEISITMGTVPAVCDNHGDSPRGFVEKYL